MIKLKNVSKFYYSKGVIASGFTKVNLKFEIGEFIAITGESGSGKSTLLNVISGLDTYEEGEMYINGLETSHYLEKDWEDYRRKYIGNIYQNFNLINSYTVYQNIELVLILNGLTKKEAKPKVLDLIDKVGLNKFRKTKVSKLSGGQKQRVAIARALAKDVPIIIADEPTGNLDKRSAESVIKLLSELSKDKLVIIVTHNYEQISDYATRRITMHDGKVLEDKKIKQVKYGTALENHYKNITFFNKLKLGFRNTFNVAPKFILLLMVYLFIVVALMTEYSSFKKGEYEASKSGYNYLFQDLDESRIVIKKNDKTSFSQEEITKLEALKNIQHVMKNDAIVDQTFFLSSTDNTYYIDGIPKNIKQLVGKPDIGRMPEADNEIVIAGNKKEYYIGTKYEELMSKTYSVETSSTSLVQDDLKSYKIVGIKYKNDLETYQYQLYFTEKAIDKFQVQTNEAYSKTVVSFLGKNHKVNSWEPSYKVVPNNKVPLNEAFISEDNKYICHNENCLGQNININISNLYYQDTLTIRVSKYYNSKNIASVLEMPNYNKENFDLYNGIIFINPGNYNNLYNKDTYQMSIYVKDPHKIQETVKELNDLNYNTLVIKDTLVQPTATVIVRVFKIIVTIILVATLFFITYFVIKLILKSRNIYYTTIRMLGSPKKVARQLLIIELFIVANIAYFAFDCLIYLNGIGTIKNSILQTINEYLSFNDYILIYLILVFLSFLISEKYAAKIFKKSVMNSYREEV